MLFLRKALAILTTLILIPAWANEQSKDDHLEYKNALTKVFSSYLEFEGSVGENRNCSLLFTVDAQGLIKKIGAKSCDLSGTWELGLLTAVSQMREARTLPPSSQPSETNVREMIFFRSDNGTTVSPPIREMVQPLKVPELPILEASPGISRRPDKLSNSGNTSASSEEDRAQQIAEEMKNEQTFGGVKKSKDKLLSDARKQNAQTDNCPPDSPRLNIDAIPTYLARSEAISVEVAKTIEDFTGGKLLRYEAVDSFNRLVTRSNALIKWGRENRVTGACGTRSLVARVGKENAARRELFKQYKVLLDQK